MALGSMHLSLSDFDALTPEEFNAAYTSYERTFIREEWERVRFLATATLSPWTKKSLKATDVVRFTWDNEKRRSQSASVDRTAAEQRFRKLIQGINDKDIHRNDKDAEGAPEVEKAS